MKIINPSATIIAFTPNLEEIIELAGRTCYKSEAAMSPLHNEFSGRWPAIFPLTMES